MIMQIGLISNWGFILLAVWLIISGILTALSIENPVIRIILGIVAAISGILILIGK